MNQQHQRAPLTSPICDNNPQTAKNRGEGPETVLLHHKCSLGLLPSTRASHVLHAPSAYDTSKWQLRNSGCPSPGVVVTAAVHGGLPPLLH